MRFDEYGVLVSEIHTDTEGGFAGNRGDSMANTARLALIKPDFDKNILNQFVTPMGYLRHPSQSMLWRENDIPTDQCLPFYLAANDFVALHMLDRVKKAGWRTGNGDLVSPLFYAVLKGSQWKIDLCLVAQMAIFKIPFRWSDSKKWFESSADSSADVLNWFHCLPLASPWVRKLVNKDHVKNKIHSYFKPEPNVKFLLDLYDQAIDKVLA